MSEPIEIRDALEIQKAHDVLAAIMLKEIPFVFSQKDLEYFHVAADTLCWVLRHSHNQNFETNLKNLYESLSEAGIYFDERRSKTR